MTLLIVFCLTIITLIHGGIYVFLDAMYEKKEDAQRSLMMTIGLLLITSAIGLCGYTGWSNEQREKQEYQELREIFTPEEVKREKEKRFLELQKKFQKGPRSISKGEN